MKLTIKNTAPEYAGEIVELMEKLKTHPLVKSGKIKLNLEAD